MKKINDNLNPAECGNGKITSSAAVFPQDKVIYAEDGKTVIGAVHGDSYNGASWSAWSRTPIEDTGFSSWQILSYHNIEFAARQAVWQNHLRQNKGAL